jgi:uncharacterized protein YjbJ (UPF0337 family)
MDGRRRIPTFIGSGSKDRDARRAADSPGIGWSETVLHRYGRENDFPAVRIRSLKSIRAGCAERTPVPAQPLLFKVEGKGGGPTMASGKSDELKGRVKEAAGALTGDKKLKRQGKTDQAVGKIKQKVEKVIDKVKDALS